MSHTSKVQNQRSTIYVIGVAAAFLLAGCGGGVESRKVGALGRAFLARGDYGHAAAAFEEAVRLDPKNGDAYYRLGLISWDTGRPGLEGNLRRAVDIDPRNADALGKLGELYLLSYQRHRDPRWRARYVDEIRDFASRLLAVAPESYQGLRLSGYAKLYSGDFPGAVQTFEATLRTDPKASTAPAVAGELVRALSSDNRIDQAEAFASAYLAEHPDAKPVYEALSSYYETHRQIPRAAAILEKRARANPRDPDAVLSLAELFHRADRSDDCRQVLERLLSEPATFPEGPVLVGDFCVRTGDLPLAVHAYQLAARIPGRSGAMRLKEAELLRKQHRYDEALRVVRSLDPQLAASPEAVLFKNTILADLGFPGGPNAVLGELTRLRERIPKDGRLVVQVGRAQQAKGNMTQAADEFRTAEFLMSDSAEAAIAMARWSAAQRDVSQMRDAAVLAVQLDPDNVDAKLVRGVAAVEMGEIGEARRNLEQVLRALPGESEAEYYLARLNLKEGKQKEAEAGFRKMAERGDTRSTLALADLYSGQQRYPLAAQTLRAAMVHGPSKELKRAYAHVAVSSGAFDEAIPILRELKTQSPEDGAIRVDLVTALQGKKDAAAAFSEAKEAEKRGMKDPVLLMQLAQLYADVGNNPAEARRVYGLVWQARPDNALAGARLAGLILMNGGDLLAAQAIAEQAVRINPTDPEVGCSLAQVYFKRGLYGEALSIYKNLIEKYPGNVKLRVSYAQALLQQGQSREARQELETALNANPPSREAELIRAQLRQF